MVNLTKVKKNRFYDILKAIWFGTQEQATLY